MLGALQVRFQMIFLLIFLFFVTDNTVSVPAVEYAVDMVNEANTVLIDTTSPSRGYVNIRVGFHSGSVVSNVIGSLNKRYGVASSNFFSSYNTVHRRFLTP